MRKTQLLAVLSLFLLVPASITRAQTISSQKGLTTAVFSTQYGNVKVYLPDDIMPGEVISGTVVAEPKGINARQIEKNLTEIKKFQLKLDDLNLQFEKWTIVPDKPIEFNWLVNKDRTISCPVELYHPGAFKPQELTLKFIQPKAESMNDNRGSISGCIIPSHALTDAPCRITGNFDGDASNTKCSLNNQLLQVLAESPRQCQVQYPKNATGLQTMQVTENGQEKCSRQISGVNMQVTTGDLDLRKGQNTFIDVKLTGLQNLPDTALLTITNVTPNIVTMTNGNLQVFAIMFTDSEGVWEVHCPAVSIATGNFSVNINLDLPEVQGDHPPTQPQPGDNPHPGDTTQPQPQPHDSTTVAQCPKCNCSCSASIFFDAKDGDVSTFSVAVKAACTGEFGYPPCKACGIIDAYIYDWTVSSSADKPVTLVGRRNGPVVKISNPLNGSFTLTIIIKVTCSDGSTCTCTAKTSYDPTIPEDPGTCQCKADCSIKKIGSNCDEADFEAVVKAECKASKPGIKCAVAKITYLWFIGESGKGIARISGKADGEKVKVKLSGAGGYTLYLKVTVTCTNKTTCETICNIEETVADCIVTHEWCAGPSIKVKAMGYFPADPSLTNNMRPGDLIGLSVYGTDVDVLLQKCINGKNVDITPHPPSPDQVAYLWSIKNIRGTSGKIISVAGITSNSILYQIPYCITDYPVEDRITVTLSNAGYKKDDEEVQVEFTIRLGTVVKYIKYGNDMVLSLYKVLAVVEGRILNHPEDIVCPAIRGCCQALLPATPEEGAKLTITDPIRFTFARDSFPDNMILLNANASDNDNLIIKCRTTGGKIITRKIEGIYDDPEYTWKVIKGNARFVYDTGSTVVLIHNYNDKMSSRNDLVIECRVKNRTLKGNTEQFIDKEPEPLHADRETRKKPIALVGVGNCPKSNARNAAAIASCKYKNAGYDVILDYDLDLKEIESAFKNPATQACFLIGDGAEGNLETHDHKNFYDDLVTIWTTEKWGCSGDPVLHPSISELHLLGSETKKGKWVKKFFRPEQYFAYENDIYDCTLDISSEIVPHAEKFVPSSPRIAPSGEVVFDTTSCCMCGPDITVALKLTLDGVIAVYKRLTTEHRFLLCQSLVNVLGDFSMAWDMQELRNPIELCKPPCCSPFSSCDATVQVNGGCYRNSSVNYILFGVMCKLCGFSPETMAGLIQGWKGPILSLHVLTEEIPNGKWPEGSEDFEYSSLWALIGYYYDQAGLVKGIRSEVPCAAKCPNPWPYSHSHFTVRWGSIKDFLEGAECWHEEWLGEPVLTGTELKWKLKGSKMAQCPLCNKFVLLDTYQEIEVSKYKRVKGVCYLPRDHKGDHYYTNEEIYYDTERPTSNEKKEFRKHNCPKQ